MDPRHRLLPFGGLHATLLFLASSMISGDFNLLSKDRTSGLDFAMPDTLVELSSFKLSSELLNSLSHVLDLLASEVIPG